MFSFTLYKPLTIKPEPLKISELLLLQITPAIPKTSAS